MKTHQIRQGYDLSQIEKGDKVEWPEVDNRETEYVRSVSSIGFGTICSYEESKIAKKIYFIIKPHLEDTFKGIPTFASSLPISITPYNKELNRAGML